MNAALVKIDVAATLTGKSVGQLFDLADGGSLLEAGLEWVWNLANDPRGDRRDLRFWVPELQAIADGASDGEPSGRSIDWVINQILPKRRENFHAGEIDQLFQIRPRTRIDLHGELAGSLKSGRNQYHRDDLATFLKRRWLGARYNFPAATPASPRATARISADTNKESIHAGQPL